MSWTRKLKGWLELAAVALVGLAAAVFIAACSKRTEPAEQPAAPAPQPRQEPRQGPPKEPAQKGAGGSAVDRKEVEEGQPLPRNYLE